MPGRILLVDDDRAFADQVDGLLKSEGYSVTIECESARVARLAAQSEFEVVLLDIQMPAPDGLELLGLLSRFEPAPEIIMLSGAATLQQAADSVRQGAADFLEKPPDVPRLLTSVRNCCRSFQLKLENQRLRAEKLGEHELIGDSPVMHELRITIGRVAPTDSTVLIWGETGTGKELVAGQLHYLSGRVSGPFIRVNCAAIPAELAESELFGHKKGAFTGATHDQPGRFLMADRGTLVLDEIAEMPPALQSKLLRVVETAEVQRLGDSEPRKVDVRLICISGRDLQQAVREGKFRADLYYRISAISISVPPLRDRRQDLPALFGHFFERLKHITGQPERRYEPELPVRLMALDWPGNVRQLRNFVERTFFMVEDESLSWSAAEKLWEGGVQRVIPHETEAGDKNLLTQATERFERDFLAVALQQTAGNVAELARALRIDRGNLHRKLSRYGLL